MIGDRARIDMDDWVMHCSATRVSLAQAFNFLRNSESIESDRRRTLTLNFAVFKFAASSMRSTVAHFSETDTGMVVPDQHI
jgi:hypothetical protein